MATEPYRVRDDKEGGKARIVVGLREILSRAWAPCVIIKESLMYRCFFFFFPFSLFFFYLLYFVFSIF